jgi:FKBP-type peptidyl-prolyl cis-trans isomerase
MPVGSKWQLFVPSDLAYGPRGAGAKIGPNVTLVFEVKLLGIEDKSTGAKASEDETSTEADRPATLVAQNETSTGAANDATTIQHPAVDVTDIRVSFKLDPRLMGGTYAQPGWVAPMVYEGIQGQNVVVARADGFDEKGQLIEGIEPQWIPEDPQMVSVSAGEGGSVKITINGPTESGLKLVYGEFSKTLSVTATTNNDILQIKISQL